MNSVSRLRAQMQIALVTEAFRRSSNIPELTNLAAEYSINGEPEIINSSIKSWENKGYLIVSRTLDGYVCACLRQDCVTEALEEVLDLIGANTFKVDWNKEEISTDADNVDLIAAREGWKLFKIQKEKNLAHSINHKESNPPIQIVNNFTPVNNFNANSQPAPSSKISWAGWVGVVIAIIGIVTSVWLAGKL